MCRVSNATVALTICGLLAACGGTVEPNPLAGAMRSERVWVDPSRPTPRTATYDGAPERTLRVLIWQPPARGPTPLLLMAHGFGGLPEKFDAFARTVAAAGFVVAAPAFPLTNQEAPGGHEQGFRDFVNQPADLSFVLTELLRAAGTPGDPLQARIAASQVAVLGHSLGGTTAVALTRKACCRDDRFVASILVAAAVPLVSAFGPDPVAAEGPPTLLIHGTADRSVGYGTSTTFYDHIQPPRYFLGLSGAGHSEALESQTVPAIGPQRAAQQASIAFLNALFRGAHTELDETFAMLAAAGNVTWIETEPPTVGQ